MKHKVRELEGDALDDAVGNAAGVDMLVDDGAGDFRPFMPSRNWDQGGPIIERERIVVWPTVVFSDPPNPNELDIETYQWAAYHRNNKGLGGWFNGTGGVDVTSRDGMPGPTPLIAAMRAYVASKFGDEVELP